MRAALPMLLALAGCSAAGGQSPTSNVSIGPTAEQVAAADNMAVESEASWTDVIPNVVFDPQSKAKSLPRPAGLARARFGYFGDGVMTRQYSARQLREMLVDNAGFTLSRDVDGDGYAETYRTGYWRMTDEREGTFLAVFDRGRPPQVVDSTNDTAGAVFLSASGKSLYVAACNCRWMGEVTYGKKLLSIRWSVD